MALTSFLVPETSGHVWTSWQSTSYLHNLVVSLGISNMFGGLRQVIDLMVYFYYSKCWLDFSDLCEELCYLCLCWSNCYIRSLCSLADRVWVQSQNSDMIVICCRRIRLYVLLLFPILPFLNAIELEIVSVSCWTGQNPMFWWKWVDVTYSQNACCMES